MWELIGLGFHLMGTLVAIVLVLFVAIFVAVFVLVTLCRFGLAVLNFGWGAAFSLIKEGLSDIAGKKQ